MNGGVDPVDGFERTEVEQGLEVLLLSAHRSAGKAGERECFAVTEQMEALCGEFGATTLQRKQAIHIFLTSEMRGESFKIKRKLQTGSDVGQEIEGEIGEMLRRGPVRPPHLITETIFRH